MADIPYHALNVLLEATESCNLRCKYCFHAEEGYIANQMKAETYEKICQLTFPYYEQLQFLWHGGEPLCAGLDFFREVTDIQNFYRKKYPIKVINAMQTNGTQIDDDTAKFLAENEYSVGISFDGVTNEETRGKTQDTLHGIRLLRQYGVQNIGAITVVCGTNIDRLPESYQLMKELGLSTDYNSLILTGGAKNNAFLQLDLDYFCEKMIDFFELWLKDTECKIVVNPFVSYVRDIYLNRSSLCWHTSCLGRWINVKPDGAVFPCSREYPSKYSFGNIHSVNSIAELFSSDGFERLLEETITRREKCASECSLYNFCQGGCSCNALTESGITNNGGFTCRAFQRIFSYIYQRLQNMDLSTNLNPTIRDLLQQERTC